MHYLMMAMGFPGGSDSKESTCNAGDPDLIPGSERSPGEGNGKTHSSILAWRIPWTEEPGGLQSMGPPRVGHDTPERARTTGEACGDVCEPHSTRTCSVPVTLIFNLSGSQFLKCKPGSQISKLSSGALDV